MAVDDPRCEKIRRQLRTGFALPLQSVFRAKVLAIFRVDFRKIFASLRLHHLEHQLWIILYTPMPIQRYDHIGCRVVALSRSE